MAERVGFEPTDRLPHRLFSRQFRYDHSGTSPRCRRYYTPGIETLSIGIKSIYCRLPHKYGRIARVRSVCGSGILLLTFKSNA